MPSASTCGGFNMEAIETEFKPGTIKTGFTPPSHTVSYSPQAFKGESPPRRDIIAGRLPRGKVIILAGEGDIGKSWLVLEAHHAINDGASEYAFGGQVVKKHLPCIYLSGEDDFVTLDHRLKTLRERSPVEPKEWGLLIPAPNIGPMPLVKDDYAGQVKPTDVYEWLDIQLAAQIAAHGELGFLAVDTWSTFFPIDANDNSKCQQAISIMAELATKHDVCIIITHHVSKGSDHGTRAAIRGASALVDGSRGAYTFFRANENETTFVHTRLHRDAFKGDVLKLRIVKNNLGLRRDDITYVRQEDGRLSDVSSLLRDDVNPSDALVGQVAKFNALGIKVTKTGTQGLNALKSDEWPSSIFRKGRNDLETLAGQLIGQGRLAVGKGGSLYVPE